MTGFRKKEVTYSTWPDVDLKPGVVRVTAKPEHGFRPKDWEEREVPIPDKLIASLKRWEKKRKGSAFVFPTRNGTRYLKPARGKGIRAKVNATFATSAS